MTELNNHPMWQFKGFDTVRFWAYHDNAKGRYFKKKLLLDTLYFVSFVGLLFQAQLNDSAIEDKTDYRILDDWQNGNLDQFGDHLRDLN